MSDWKVKGTGLYTLGHPIRSIQFEGIEVCEESLVQYIEALEKFYFIHGVANGECSIKELREKYL